MDWYRRWRIRKTIRRKLGELNFYIRPGFNTLSAARKISEIYADVKELQKELK